MGTVEPGEAEELATLEKGRKSLGDSGVHVQMVEGSDPADVIVADAKETTLRHRGRYARTLGRARGAGLRLVEGRQQAHCDVLIVR